MSNRTKTFDISTPDPERVKAGLRALALAMGYVGGKGSGRGQKYSPLVCAISELPPEAGMELQGLLDRWGVGR